MTLEDVSRDIADKHYRFPCTEAELIQLIQDSMGHSVHCAIGSGDLIWEKGTPRPWCVTRLAEIRGILNANCEGAGI